jgi:2-oxoisovalerate dehydrogenase E2 component (dihydrolipoyl transacylase)
VSVKEFRLPDLGEGLTESEVAVWRVAVGDTVALNQVIAEIETAKALVDLPSPYAGVVTRLFVETGTTVTVGDPIIAFEVDGPVADETPPNLVGYGAVAESSTSPARRARTLPVAAQPAVAQVAGAHAGRLAAPPVRQLAHRLGVDLSAVVATGESGIVTRSDVERSAPARSAPSLPAAAPSPASASTARGSVAETSVSDTLVPVTGVHRLMADAMVASAFTAPHVTVFLTVDVTATVDLLDELRPTSEFRDLRLTFLAAVAKAVCSAMPRHPGVNARWDESAGGIIRSQRIGLGIAAATPRGLIVPTIPNAGALDLAGIATALTELTRVAKAGRSSPADLAGGTFTISNVGVFGVDAGTPILHDGQAAILAVGAVARRPWEFDGTVALRQLVTLSLSFDHRVLDGEQGSRFLAEVAALLHNPARAFSLA